MSKLSTKHKAFCDEYLSNGMIAYKAYLSVYKSVKKKTTAEVNSSKLLSNAKIRKYIADKQAKTAKKLDVTRESTLKSNQVHERAYEKLLELSMKEKLDAKEEVVFSKMLMVVKASDAIKAREMNAKLLGLFLQDDDGKDFSDINIDVQIKRNKDAD